VLLEAVLALPLFMVMLGGMCWISDLMMTRQKLLVADRYVAWNRGLRYADRGSIGAGDLHRLFFSDKYQVPSPYHAPTVQAAVIERDYDWSQAAGGQVGVKATMPDWVYSMVNVTALLYRQNDLLANFVHLHGREKAGQRHVVLMRTYPKWQPSYIRNKYGVPESGEVAGQWRQIAGEKWPYE